MKQRIAALLEWAVIAGTLATIPLVILQEQGNTSASLSAIDWAIWSVFAAEFLFFFFFVPRSDFDWSTRVARLAVVLISLPLLPNLLGLVRLTRLVRLLRLARLAGVAALGIAELKIILGRRGVLHVAAVTSFLILAGGAGISMLEPQTVKGGIGDGMWWAVVTASTVGYGDISPSTLWGRIIAVLLMLLGIGLMSTLAASITSYFVHETADSEFKQLAARLERIERLLEEQKNDPKVILTEAGAAPAYDPKQFQSRVS